MRTEWSRRGSHILGGRPSTQHPETFWKQLESGSPLSKFANRANRMQYFEPREAAVDCMKGDAEMSGQQAQICYHMAEESRAKCSPVFRKFKHNHRKYQWTSIPNIFQEIQVMRERRGVIIGKLIEDIGRGWSVGDTNDWEINAWVE